MDLGGLKVKDLPPVLTAASLIDVCLSKTQRKTPTEIHKRSNINVIKKFYIRKIKTCAQFFIEKLKAIIVLFPKLDSVHPFYGDLLNILYDRDHYKLALGQVAACINRIERISKEYITLSKYSDSLYKSKIVKKLSKVFEYLEEVRMHLQRLPVIQTSARTLLLAGFPNVGKSSFVNRLSNANVEVQPFAFTTKSLFVGHFDHLYTRWQIIDTPGILDHPLEERNLIEMLAIAALTHLHCVVLFVIDVSEECGYSVAQQVALFKSIHVLFKNKPKVVILNKTDKVKPEDLELDAKQLLKQLETEADVSLSATSTLTGDGLDEAKNLACELLLQQRMMRKAAAVASADPAAAAVAAATGSTPLASAAATAALGVKGPAAAMLHVSSVQQPRQPHIPESVLRELELKKQGLLPPKQRLERDIEEEEGGPGVYSYDLRKKHILANEDWRYDVVPEIFDGKNVMDFVDPEIEQKLQALEREEEELLQKELEQQDEIQDQLTRLQSVRAKLSRLHRGISHKRMEAKLRKKKNGPRLLKKTKRQLEEARRALQEESINPTAESNRKRGRDMDREPLEEDAEQRQRLRTKIRRLTRSRSVADSARKREATTHNDGTLGGVPSGGEEEEDARLTSAVVLGQKKRLGGLSKEKAMQLKRSVDRKLRGTAGESDRFIQVKKVKWMMSGKRGIGKTHSR
ncbi:nucleolar GTP-binding protein 1 [Cyclospora cayetanensis]|uniref:Nucleolar GTP-binding protein 1 n=1 Tax=Cyclospora cayetanensis TaxID=88456 RepID=A0A6P6S1C7_9EIME|nr:nucleolar GTP-binding protein 1 [Cyclospora cayetanensis]